MTAQAKRLLEYLKTNKKITPIQAWHDLGIYRLSDTVLKLRNDDYNINTVRTSSYNKFQEKVSFATYVLED